MSSSVQVESIYVGAEGRLICALPPPPASVEGAAEWERLLAVAEWAPEEAEEVLTFYNVVLSNATGSTTILRGDVKRRFILQGAATAMQVSDLGQRGALLVAGTSAGCLFRAQLVSTDSYSRDTQWRLLDSSGTEEDRLRPWQRLHSGEVAGLDLWRDSQQAVTVGQDGAVFLADALSEAPPQRLQPARSCVSYAAVKWASPTSFVTAGTTGGLEVWDRRSWGAGPCLRSPLEWGHTGLAAHDRQQGMRAQITCLDVHPSRPFLCATGGTAGTAALWDLRFQAAPAALHSGSLASTDVTEVHFEGQSDSGSNALLLSTLDGRLLSAPTEAQSQAGSETMPLIKDVHNGIPSFACDPARPGNLFCLAGWECLLHAARV